jgi:hypothetical protein
MSGKDLSHGMMSLHLAASLMDLQAAMCKTAGQSSQALWVQESRRNARCQATRKCENPPRMQFDPTEHSWSMARQENGASLFVDKLMIPR